MRCDLVVKGCISKPVGDNGRRSSLYIMLLLESGSIYARGGEIVYCVVYINYLLISKHLKIWGDIARRPYN